MVIFVKRCDPATAG